MENRGNDRGYVSVLLEKYFLKDWIKISGVC